MASHLPSSSSPVPRNDPVRRVVGFKLPATPERDALGHPTGAAACEDDVSDVDSEDFDSEDDEQIRSSASSSDTGKNQKTSAAKLLGVLGPGADTEATRPTRAPREMDVDAPLEDIVWRRLYITSDVAARNAKPPTSVKPKDEVTLCPHGRHIGFCKDTQCMQVSSAHVTGVQKRLDGVYEFCVAVGLQSGGQITIWHRYSAFRRLFKVLSVALGPGVLPPFPGKRINHGASVARARIPKLNEFLEGVIAHSEIRERDEFKRFFSPDIGDRSMFYKKD